MGRLTDVRTAFPQRTGTIFDVGANIGDTVTAFRRAFPAAPILAFEPVAQTFAVLKDAFRDDPQVQVFQQALGEAEGLESMTAHRTSGANRIVRCETALASVATEIVPVVTGDAVCAEHGIDRVFFLKVDTEGHDLAVLKGFSNMIARGQIDIIQVEAGMNPTNELHVDLGEFRSLLEPQGYYLFNIYNQVRQKGRHFLRRCNPVFVSAAIA
jgi:FkbM family methyltransferase